MRSGLRILLALAILTATSRATAQSAVVQECSPTPPASLPSQLPSALEAVGTTGTHIDQAFRLCGDSTKWVVSVDLPARDIGVEYGWRIAFLVDSGGQFVVRDVSPGFSDSHAPILRLFRAGVEYLLLAALGDEGGSWGMTSFDVGPFALHNLGLLDVGVTDTTDVGNDDSALELAQVLFRTDGWRVVFHQPVVLRPNQDTRQVVKPRNGAITFRPSLGWLQAQ